MNIWTVKTAQNDLAVCCMMLWQHKNDADESDEMDMVEMDG